MNRFTFTLYLAFIASLLSAGCTAPTYLMNPPEPSPEEKIQQALESPESWKGDAISKVIQKWGTPHGITDDGKGWHIYIWQTPVPGFLPRKHHQIISSQRQTNSFRGVVQADALYELIFYIRPNGIIYKTLTKRSQGCFTWK